MCNQLIENYIPFEKFLRVSVAALKINSHNHPRRMFGFTQSTKYKEQ